MKEMTRVATKGSWVRMIVNTSAGSSGMRRIHACLGVSSSWFGTWAGGGAMAVVVLMPEPPSRSGCLQVSVGGGCGLWSLLVGHPDLGGEFLALVQGVGDAELSGDCAGDVLGDLRTQRRELWDVDELDADGGSGLHPGVGGVGFGDGRLGGLGECRGGLQVLRILIRG